MSTVADIEAAVTKLTEKELSAFRKWFADYAAEQWDRQIEKDVKAGRLDKLAEGALNDLEEGRCTDL